MKPPAQAEAKFAELRMLIARLRSPDGCPWDRAQQPRDIGRCLIEEAYEVLEALERSSPEHLREELGDLLFQILFLARIAEERGEFTTADLLAEIIAKMVRRHPHVFGGQAVGDADEVVSNWERIKREVEQKGAAQPSLCEGIPRSLPTLAKAERITARAAEVGFDWPDLSGVLQKIEEELAEFRAALDRNDPQRIEEEAGDLLFTLVNLCRFARVDAENALRLSLGKFIRRFSAIEQALAAGGTTLQAASPAELDRLWEEAKKNERKA